MVVIALAIFNTDSQSCSVVLIADFQTSYIVAVTVKLGIILIGWLLLDED